MITRRELRQNARNTLSGKWMQPVLATLIYILIAGVTSGFSGTKSASLLVGGGLISLLVAGNLGIGLQMGILRFNRGREETVKEMFSAAFKEDYARILGLFLLQAVFILLWMLLFIIPGFIKAYAYSMSVFIAEDNPELGPLDCIKRSQEMMKGHKMDLFILDLSFIGWILLGILSLGIGMLWVSPWMYMAHAKFYEELKNEAVMA